MAARPPEPGRASFGKDFYEKSIGKWPPGRRSRPGRVLKGFLLEFYWKTAARPPEPGRARYREIA